MKKIIIIFIFITLILSINFVAADQNLAQKLSGRILLQVELNGEAWYINPGDNKKYYLGRPKDAFDLMHNLALGITNQNLAKIPIGLINYLDADDDNDGLANRLENAIGTDPRKSDTDYDGYDDKFEIENNYDPLSDDKLNIDPDFAENYAGKIFLQVEDSGQAWYINPNGHKRYYLGRPNDAFLIMRQLSLGITNNNLDKISFGYLSPQIQLIENPPDGQDECKNCQTNDADKSFYDAASAIRSGNTNKAISYFIPDMQKAIEYTMEFLDEDGKFTLGNIMAGATLSSSTNNEKTYSTEIYFSLGGYKVPVNFYVEKQEDGTWLLTNL